MSRGRLAAISVAAFLITNTVAFADPVSSASQAPAASPGSDPDEVVCRMGDPPTGSRLGARRICQTRKEWEQQTKESQTALGTLQTKGLEGGQAGH